MLNWLFPVIVVRVDTITVDDETNGDAKESRDTKFDPGGTTTITKLSVTPDFVKRHMNYIYMFKENTEQVISTPTAKYSFELQKTDNSIVVIDEHNDPIGVLQDDGTIYEYE